MTGTAPEQVRNPLGYRCASNAAAPDVVAAHRLDDFVAYCLTVCWVSVGGEPGDAVVEWPAPFTPRHVRDLRRQFLHRLEAVAQLYYDGELVEAAQFDGWLDFGDSDGVGVYAVNVSVVAEGAEGDDDEDPSAWVDLSWAAVLSPGDNSLRFELGYDFHPYAAADPDVAWLEMGAFDDRREALRVFSRAYAAIGGQPWWPAWQRHVDGAPGFDWDRVHRDLRRALADSGFVFPCRDPVHAAIAADYLDGRGEHGLAYLLRHYYEPPDVRGLVLPGDTP